MASNFLSRFRKPKVDLGTVEPGPGGVPTIGRHLVDGYELRVPSPQTAIDLVSGWVGSFPPDKGLHAGALQLYDDSRIQWAIEQFGSLEGKRVLELGPLEAAHTRTLEQAGGIVDAVEGNGNAFLKCLIAKEILGLTKSRFHLGDFNRWLEREVVSYDLIVASGVLYHMPEPLRLLELISLRSPALYLWTAAVEDDSGRPIERLEHNGLSVRGAKVAYGDRDPAFCGGPYSYAMWLHRDDIPMVLSKLGYTRIEIITHEPTEFGRSLSVFASKSV